MVTSPTSIDITRHPLYADLSFIKARSFKEHEQQSVKLRTNLKNLFLKTFFKYID